MPKQAIDYSKCVIYKITCCDESVTECYVGHTTSFKDRKNQHKSSCKTKNVKLYQMIRDNGGWENWLMSPLEEYKECKNYIQACIKEEEYRVELQAQLNMVKAYQSKENRTEYKKEIDKKIRSSPTYIKTQYPEYNKEWREINVEHIKEYNKQYAQENKDKINEQRRLKYQQKKLVQSEN